jgi:hypothetical protein
LLQYIKAKILNRMTHQLLLCFRKVRTVWSFILLAIFILICLCDEKMLTGLKWISFRLSVVLKMKNFASFVCLMLVLVASTSALPGVARAAPQCPENEAGNVVFFPDTTNCQWVQFLKKNTTHFSKTICNQINNDCFLLFCEPFPGITTCARGALPTWKIAQTISIGTKTLTFVTTKRTSYVKQRMQSKWPTRTDH